MQLSLSRLFLAAALAVGAVSAAFAEAPAPKINAACSIHLGWPAPAAEWFYLEGHVEKSTPGSYFMICGWNTGYFGVQELGNGKKVAIFSVWDPTKGDNPTAVKLEDRVEVLHEGKDVRVSRFGGEGTGGKSMMDFSWKLGEKIRCIVHTKVEGDNTAYAGWLWLPEKNEWKHLVTFRVHTGGKPLTGLYSFVEDFRRDGKSVTEERRAVFGNGWVKTVTEGIVPLTHAKFTASRAPTEARDVIDAGPAQGGLYLANGGGVKMSRPVGSLLELTPPPLTVPSDLPSEIFK